MSNKRKKSPVRGSTDLPASTAAMSGHGTNQQNLADEVYEYEVVKNHVQSDIDGYEGQQIDASSVTAADTRLTMTGGKQEVLGGSSKAKSSCKCKCGHMEAEHMPHDGPNRKCEHTECTCWNHTPVQMDDDNDIQETPQEGHQAAGEFEHEEVDEYEKPTVNHVSELIINDEYASLIPAISDQEYQSIKQSIKDNGQWVPIIVNAQRIILDGYTRFRACKDLQISPRIMIHEFGDPLQEKQFIIQINRNRRHLTEFQRRELEHKYHTIQSELAKKRMSEAGKIGAEKRWKRGREIDMPESISENRVGQNYTTLSNAPKLAQKTNGKGRVIDISAKNAQVSPATYNKGINIIKQAPPQEILNNLRTGKVKIDKVYRELENHRKRQDLISKGLNSNVKLPDDVKLIGGDFTEKCRMIGPERKGQFQVRI